MRGRSAGDDPRLSPWPQVESGADWTGLFIGNGASIAVWEMFRYRSLYERALESGLDSSDERLFRAFDTENFELLLASLTTSIAVGGALSLDTTPFEERYESIQRALFDAVHQVHIPWTSVPDDALRSIRASLRDYRFVYSTNYDLLAYWSAMSEDGGEGFLDYFWGEGMTFDPFDTDIWATRELWTRILFLHGGIHIRRKGEGGTRKLTADGRNLLDQFAAAPEDGESPLLVSEGDWRDKYRSILSSDYLSFAYQAFSAHEGGLVVFGHSLSEADDHLLIPMRRWRDQAVAISLRPSDDEEWIIQQKAAFRSRLAPMTDVTFFDASTHPLGAAQLRVDPL